MGSFRGLQPSPRFQQGRFSGSQRNIPDSPLALNNPTSSWWRSTRSSVKFQPAHTVISEGNEAAGASPFASADVESAASSPHFLRSKKDTAVDVEDRGDKSQGPKDL